MKVLTDKYKVLTGTYIKEYRKYPMGLFLKLIYLPAQMLMYIFLWLNISKSNAIDLKYLISYYLLTNLLVYAYPFTHIANDIEREVMEGGISNYLVRPINYINLILAKYVAWMSLYSAIFLPAVVFVYFFREISLVQIVLFLISAIVGMGVEFMFWYNVGLISFFIERIRGIMTTALALRMFVSGSLIPLSFFAEPIRKVTYLFPFRFYIYVPVNTLLGEKETAEIIVDFAAGFAWIIMLVLLSKFLWSKGIKKIESNMS
jgi:ABC-type uncharacterized transport system permease subunit